MSRVEKDPQDGRNMLRLEKYLRSVLAGQSDVAAVYLLGSALSGKMRRDSDIDLALLPVTGQKISMRTRLELAAQLEERLNRTIDIGVITAQNLVYAREAILNGRRLVTLHRDDTEAAETRLLGSYFTFRQDRKEVEESYRVVRQCRPE
ncbi:type VII toxin-antitoxin system MntA family adenylyltransferase antitoxin [Desulfuromonas thiophila]|nr:nucleotidyltransferase domain-containing protein [Desulfuromonas thiophila]